MLSYKFNLDLRKNGVQQTIIAKQNDKDSVWLEVGLCEGTTPILLSEEAKVTLRGKITDEILFYNECPVIQGKIVYALSSEMLKKATSYYAEFEIIDKEEVKTTARIKITVEPKLYADEEIEATSEFTRLTSALIKAETLTNVDATAAEGEVKAEAELDQEGLHFFFGIPKGDTGNGIVSITKVKTEGIEDTYRITMTNGDTFDFVVTNAREVIDNYNQLKDLPKINGIVLTGDVSLEDISAASIGELERVEAIAKGKSTGLVFDTVEDMEAWISNPDNKNILSMGDNIYIKAKEVPDYWIVKAFDYAVSGKYYLISELETQKVDLSDIENEISAVDEVAKSAKSIAENTTSNLANNYSTTTQMNSAISQSASAISQSVSATIDKSVNYEEASGTELALDTAEGGIEFVNVKGDSKVINGEIKSVSSPIVVEEHNKNLFDLNTSKTENGLTVEVKGNRVITSGTPTAYVNMCYQDIPFNQKDLYVHFEGTYTNNISCQLLLIKNNNTVYSCESDTMLSNVKNYYDCSNYDFDKVRITLKRYANNVLTNNDFTVFINDVPYQHKSVTYPLTDELRGVNGLGDTIEYITDTSGYTLQTPDESLYLNRFCEVHRFGVVDLGSLNWSGSSGNFKATIENIIPNTEVRNVPNILSNRYSAYSLYDLTYVTTIGMSVSDNTKLWVKDTAYTDATTFKSAMQGVQLVYELAQPLIIPISDQQPFYELVAYKDKTFISADGLAELTMKYSGTEVGADAIESKNKNVVIPDILKDIAKLNADMILVQEAAEIKAENEIVPLRASAGEKIRVETEDGTSFGFGSSLVVYNSAGTELGTYTIGRQAKYIIDNEYDVAYVSAINIPGKICVSNASTYNIRNILEKLITELKNKGVID